MTKALVRTLGVVLAVAGLSLASAAAAVADVPEGWSDPDDVSFMHTLLVLVGVPLLCVVLIALAVYLPSIVRGESIAPAGARADDEWFGGRRDAPQALAAGRSDTDDTGGASGSW